MKNRGRNPCREVTCWFQAGASYRALQFGHSRSFLTPLMGKTGTMKKSVMNCIPLLAVNWPVVPHLPQRMGWGAGADPHVKNRVPTIKMKNIQSPAG